MQPLDDEENRSLPVAFGASVLRRRRAEEPAQPPKMPRFVLSRWAVGIVMLGVIVAAAWLVALLSIPDHIALALAHHPEKMASPTALKPLAGALSTAGPGLSLPTPAATPPSPPPAAAPNTATPTLIVRPAALSLATPTPAPAYPPTRLIIPAIELDAHVEAVGWKLVRIDDRWEIEWETPNETVGWHLNSALPGRAGNVVLSGHHNIGGMVFRRLSELKTGDAIILHAHSLVLHYQVVETHIVQERGVSESQKRENARWIGPFSEARLTLVTCWPANNNTHRVIVVARPETR